MAESTETTGRIGVSETNWSAGILGGFLGSAVMAAVMAALPPLRAVLFGAIPALYGFAPPAPVAGVVVHLVHGAIFGAGFAAFLGLPGVDDYAGTTGGIVGLGIVWGLVVWVVGAVVLMPLWLGAVGFPNAPPFPNVTPPILVLHLVYGLVLGGVVAWRG